MKIPTCRRGPWPRHPFVSTAALMALLLGPTPALAYIGPGLAFGTLMLVAGFVSSVVLAVLALFWYPLKRLLRRGRTAKQTASGTAEKPPR